VVFNLTTQVPVSGVFLVSGGGQNALINQPFANPVVFVVRDTSNNPIPGLLVNFSVAGNATATPTSATTNAQGQVQTNVTAGATTGNVVITATYNGFIGTANLVVQPPGPQVTGSSFKNAASGVVGMTPCGLVTVIGNGIAPTVQGTVSALQAGLTITANGITASILSVSNVNGVQSANFQAPCELSAGNANVVVTANTSSTIVGVPVFAVQPGIFVVDSNKQHGWVVRADGNLVTITNPARRGDHLFAILTGLGQTTTPAIVTGSPGTGLQNVNLSVGVQVSGNGVPVPSARYLAGFLGAYIVEFEIPSDSPIGLDQTLLIAEIVNGVPVYSNQLLLPAVIAQ
jgi:uncharacterized protein (TIGR03437 family)